MVERCNICVVYVAIDAYENLPMIYILCDVMGAMVTLCRFMHMQGWISPDTAVKTVILFTTCFTHNPSKLTMTQSQNDNLAITKHMPKPYIRKPLLDDC